MGPSGGRTANGSLAGCAVVGRACCSTNASISCMPNGLPRHAFMPAPDSEVAVWRPHALLIGE